MLEEKTSAQSRRRGGCLVPMTAEISLEPQNIALDVLFEDEHLIAVNKPAGVVHPAPGHPDKTFVNALLYHCRSLNVTDPVRPGIVHRLDKDTSGSPPRRKDGGGPREIKAELFAARRMHKDYLAVCVGTPREGLIDAPIRRHPTQRKEMAVCFEQGKEAKSRCQVLGKNGQLSLFQIQLLTGRTHQIRVHLKHIGAPVLGDAVYGNAGANKKFGVARQLLHASRLQFQHPIANFSLEISLPFRMIFCYTQMN